MQCLEEVQRLTSKGLYAAGFISYEASGAMDPALETHHQRDVPLIWFGLYDQPEIITLPDADSSAFDMGSWQPSVSKSAYHESIAQTKQRIRLGDTYQVNYTFRLRTSFSGDPWALFLELHKAQRGNYSAYINLGQYHICSVSPELFFSLQRGELTSKPMKGTAQRGSAAAEDREREQWLLCSEKNRAEHIMIVDMVRNDMGRIARPGSVRVEKLFCVEKYPTVLQMTSTVTSRTDAPVSEVFREMFPCASITGAPKVKTMQIIRQLEPDPRGVYTGSIGYIFPDGNSQFNVAIRTAVIDIDRHSAEFGVGGGIVWDSDADDEYEECQTKARVLFHRYPDFELLETILWTAEGGFYLLDHHLRRLQESATYFQFELSMEQLQEKLQRFSLGALPENRRIRITATRGGNLSLASFPMDSVIGAKVGIAKRTAHRRSPFLRHKTTYRTLYSELLDEQLVHRPGLTDIIASDDRGFVTDSTIANVVIGQGKELFTPAVEGDLLPGVFRQHLLENGVIREKQISVDELLEAPAVFLVNSLRGWMPLDKLAEDAWIIRCEFNYELISTC
jgi:para-aminobenzoate synthetase/4-amino-4-deoxychorismate lyase